jgi:5-deoxy-D-glucuronate isomerase
MEVTMKKYGDRIEKGEVNPHVRYDGKASGLIFDPRKEETPLEVLGFGVYQLGPQFVEKETKDREMVIVPQEGSFEAEVNGKSYAGSRIGGPFAMGPGKTNASALYVPCNAKLRIRGKGEAAFFEAPALREKPPFYFPQSEAKVLVRGDWVWRRDIVNLINPKDASTNLVVGETYSPPGFWSGTPLHVHDKDNPAVGESDMEEVYYHRLNLKTAAGSQFDAFGVQLLFDGSRMMKSYVLGDRSIVAIPGGAHPVAASPVCELLYLWGLGGKGTDLLMRDLPEFKHLKPFEAVSQALRKDMAAKVVTVAEFDALCAPYGFTGEQKALLKVMLKDQNIRIG